VILEKDVEKALSVRNLLVLGVEASRIGLLLCLMERSSLLS